MSYTSLGKREREDGAAEWESDARVLIFYIYINSKRRRLIIEIKKKKWKKVVFKVRSETGAWKTHVLNTEATYISYMYFTYNNIYRLVSIWLYDNIYIGPQ